MKVMLYRDGRPGVVTRLPEEDPMADIAELLGGRSRADAAEPQAVSGRSEGHGGFAGTV